MYKKHRGINLTDRRCSGARLQLEFYVKYYFFDNEGPIPHFVKITRITISNGLPNTKHSKTLTLTRVDCMATVFELHFSS